MTLRHVGQNVGNVAGINQVKVKSAEFCVLSAEIFDAKKRRHEELLIMQTLNWLESHIGTLKDCEDIINQFCWFLSIVEANSKWYIKSGEVVIYSADNRDSIDTFLYAMALGLNTMPPHIGNKLVEDTKAWCDSLSGLPPSDKPDD